MGLKDLMGGMQGVLGNYSEMSSDDLNKSVSPYLFQDEKIERGFKLVRDMLVFTDKRIILFDKQGMTGSKMRVLSINYKSIFDVSMETAGAGLDDSEINLTYVSSHNIRSNNVTYSTQKFEFPKNFDVISLYKFLAEIAHDNYMELNK